MHFHGLGNQGRRGRPRRSRIPQYSNITQEDFEKILSNRRLRFDRWKETISSLSDEDLKRYVAFFVYGKKTPVDLLIRMDWQLAMELKRRGIVHELIEGKWPEDIKPPPEHLNLLMQTGGPLSLKLFHERLGSIKKPEPDSLPRYSVMPTDELVREALECLRGEEFPPYELSSRLKENNEELYSVVKNDSAFFKKLRQRIYG